MAVMGSDFSELGDEALEKRIAAESKALRALEAKDDAEIVRRGESKKAIDAMDAKLDALTGAQTELRRRRHEAIADFAPARRAQREREVRRKPSPVSQAAQLMRFSPPPEIAGLTIDGANLEGDEGAELLALTKQRQAGTLTEEAQERWELLLGRAVGDSGLFPKKRREQEASAKRAALAERERKAATPESVELPSYLAEWLSNHEDGSLDAATVGVLASLALSLAARVPVLVGATFEGDALVAQGPVDQLRFVRGANDEVDDVYSAGKVRLAPALDYLTRNRLIEVERLDGGRVAIRLGERAKRSEVTTD